MRDILTIVAGLLILLLVAALALPPLIDMNDEEEVARAKGFLERLVQRALAMEGTCTGEHGVGQAKMKYLEAEHGPEALAMMRTLKQAIDPHNIMNPGKIVLA